MADTVRIEGLADLRRDLRKMAPAVLKEMRDVLKDSATLVAGDARPLAAHRTGKLAASYRPGTAGNSAFVRSRLPYAGVQEFGGRIAPRGTPITIKATPAVTRSLDKNAERIVDKLGDGIDKVAARNGFH
jgi:phage gpG-like protein